MAYDASNSTSRILKKRVYVFTIPPAFVTFVLVLVFYGWVVICINNRRNYIIFDKLY